MNNEKFLLVLVNIPNKELAFKIANSLVNEKLIACANISSKVNSIYQWDGKVVEEEEFTLHCKTVKSKYDKLEKKILELHSYQIPEIIAVEIVNGNTDYLDWVENSCKSN
jgi:periplasmic divalent cation tolerance protein